jgi:hypothetical protein
LQNTILKSVTDTAAALDKVRTFPGVDDRLRYLTLRKLAGINPDAPDLQRLFNVFAEEERRRDQGTFEQLQLDGQCDQSMKITELLGYRLGVFWEKAEQIDFAEKLVLELNDDDKVMRAISEKGGLGWAEKWYIISTLSRLNDDYPMFTGLGVIFLKALNSREVNPNVVRDQIRDKLNAQEQKIWKVVRYDRSHEFAIDLIVIFGVSWGIYSTRRSLDDEIGDTILGLTVATLSVLIFYCMVKFGNQLWNRRL